MTVFIPTHIHNWKRTFLNPFGYGLYKCDCGSEKEALTTNYAEELQFSRLYLKTHERLCEVKECKKRAETHCNALSHYVCKSHHNGIHDKTTGTFIKVRRYEYKT
jgi:hypothetical protein